MAALLNAPGMVFFVTDDQGGRVGLMKTLAISQAGIDDYRNYYVHKDVLLHHNLHVQSPAGAMLLFQDFYPDAEFRRSEFFNDYLRPIRFRYGAGGALRYDAGTMSAIAAWRPEHRGPFEQRELDLLSQLTPHL